MSVVYFEGPAGTGKTTQLVQAVGDHLEAHPLGPNQRVLALTKMHGSRRRMANRVAQDDRLHGRVDCMTIDSLAHQLVTRWRNRCRMVEVDLTGNRYEDVCREATVLLQDPIVAGWLCIKYPIIMLDEYQDSEAWQVELIRTLELFSQVFCAADAFQHLAGASQNPAVEWLRESGSGTRLEVNHRTDVAGILAAASVLRHGEGNLEQGPGFNVIACYKNMIPRLISLHLGWWRRLESVAILSPVRPDNNNAVAHALRRISERQFVARGRPYGPFRVEWETSAEGAKAEYMAALGINEAAELIEPEALRWPEGHPATIAMDRWITRQRRVSGRSRFTPTEFTSAIDAVFHGFRNVSSQERRRLATTIHQAKNREFDGVIVLWPYGVRDDLEYQRRLLYNAITRARRKAVVLAQGSADRLVVPPFRMSP